MIKKIHSKFTFSHRGFILIEKIAILCICSVLQSESVNQSISQKNWTTDLCQHLSRKRNPFSDLVGSDDDSEDDFVDFDDLPPLPEKSLPKPNIEDFPKQKINKTRSQAQRIGKISKGRARSF